MAPNGSPLTGESCVLHVDFLSLFKQNICRNNQVKISRCVASWPPFCCRRGNVSVSMIVIYRLIARCRVFPFFLAASWKKMEHVNFCFKFFHRFALHLIISVSLFTDFNQIKNWLILIVLINLILIDWSNCLVDWVNLMTNVGFLYFNNKLSF